MEKRIKTLRSLGLAWVMICGLSRLWASHAVGNHVTWDCDPLDPCRLIFSFHFYRDCSGMGFPIPPIHNFRGCGNALSSVNWVGGLVSDITPLCPGLLSNCSGGTVPGVEYFRHTMSVDFCQSFPGCNSVTVDWNTCCRNASITSLIGPENQSMTTVFTVPINRRPCNNSPRFDTPSVLYLCNGQVNTSAQGATDPDGNTLRYALIPCMQFPTTQVDYATGFSPTAPLGPGWNVNLNPSTGDLTLTPAPSSIQTGVLCLQVDELDAGGNVIGTVVRDIQVRVLDCQNTLPAISGPFHHYACIDQPFCLNVSTSDLDPGDQLDLLVLRNTTGAPVIVTGGQYPTASVCFTPTALGTYTVSFEVRDDACPLLGIRQFTYNIEVLNCKFGSGGNGDLTEQPVSTPGNSTPARAHLDRDDVLHLELADRLVGKGPVEMAVFDLSGRLLHSTTVSGEGPHRLPLPGLASGIYLMRLYGNGHQVTIRLIK